jgi:predicted aspartyl protease
MPDMGQFSVPVRLTGPTGRSEEAELFVDTGATLVIVPRELAERLGLVVKYRKPVLLAGGAVETWPIAEVRVAIGDEEVPTLCFIAPDGPGLLGAVALESLLLAVDPVAKRLVPTRGLAFLS